MTRRKISEFATTQYVTETDYIPLIRESELDVNARNKKATVSTLSVNFNFGGRLLCDEDCYISKTGKVWEFFHNVTNIPLIIKVGFDINISSGNSSIQLHRWNQLPNGDLLGREWYKDISHTGGIINFTNNSTYRWISIFAKNPNKNDYDAVCFNVEGNVITLVGYS